MTALEPVQNIRIIQQNGPFEPLERWGASFMTMLFSPVTLHAIFKSFSLLFSNDVKISQIELLRGAK